VDHSSYIYVAWDRRLVIMNRGTGNVSEFPEAEALRSKGSWRVGPGAFSCLNKTSIEYKEWDKTVRCGGALESLHIFFSPDYFSVTYSQAVTEVPS
jgi:hypothetical protein